MDQAHETEEKEDVINSIMHKFRDECLFGIVEFHYMNGHVVRIKKTESFEPKEFDHLITK